MNKKNLRRTMTGLIAALVLIMQIPVGGVTLEKADSQSMRMQGTAVRVQAAESAFPETPSEGQSVWTGTAEEFEETAGYAETAQEAAEYAEIPEDYEETAGYAETAQEAAEYAEIPEDYEETAGYAETGEEAAEYAEIPEDGEETAGYAETAQEASEYSEIPEDDEETAGYAETGEETAAPEEVPEDYEENAGLAETGEEAAEPEEGSEDGEEAAAPEEAPEDYEENAGLAETGEEAAEPEEGPEDGEEAAEPEEVSEDEEEAAEPEEVLEDGEETAGPEEVSEDEEEAAEPKEGSEDGEKAAEPEIITEDGEEAAEPEKTAEDAAASGETAAGNGASAEEAVPSQEPGEEFVLEEFPDGLEEIVSEEEAYAEPAVNGVYAVIYSDGRMVFQVGPATEAGAGVVTQYPVEMEGKYDLHSDEIPNTPWYEQKDSVTKVDFKDSIAPKAVDYWFMGFSNLEEITNLSNLDVSRVTTMRGMFQGCAKLKELVLIENNKGIWDTSNVTDMRRMFFGCTSLRKLDLSTLNTSSVTELEETFTDCTGLTELSLIRWDVSSVTNLKGLLRGCANLKEVDLSSWNTSNVGDMSEMFSGCGDLQVIHASGNFDTGNVSVSGSMFLGCFALKGSSGTVYSEDHLNAEYARIDMPGDPGYFSQGVYAILYEDGVMAFQYGDTPDGHSGVYKIYPVDMIDGYAMTGRRETNVPWEESVDLVKMVVIVDRIAPRDVSLWFYQFHNMESVRNPENLDLSRAVRMIDLFFGCESLKSIDMSTWDTSGITSVHGVFYDCKSLKKLDVTTWNTSKMGDMSALFRNCENLEEVDVSGFDVSSTYHFGSVFRECRKLTNIDVSSWDTSGGQVFGGMFSGCTGLTELDLSGWDTSASVQFQEQFRDCVNLKTILASDRFVTTSLGRDDLDDNMFTGCTALVGGYGTPYDPNYTDSTYARIDTADTPGYFTKKSYEIRVTSSFTKNASPSQDQTFPLNAGVNGGAKLTYKSDQTGVTVSNDGNVTIKKGFAGSAVITITAAGTEVYQDTEAKVTVTVKKIANTISVTKSITKNASPSQDQTFQLNAGVNGGAKLTYKSDQTGVTVSNDGNVTIKKGFAGSAEITVSAAETGCYRSAEAKVAVTVKKLANTISVTKSITKNASPSQNQTFPLNAGVNGGAQLSYKSNRAGVTVSENGTVTIKKRFAGSAVITVSAAETECYRSAETKVTVTVKKISNTINVAKSFTKTASPSQDQAFRLNARADGGAQLSYKSNRAGVTVSENGTVTIKKRFAGSAVITITAAETRCTLGAEKKVTLTVKKATNAIRVTKSFTKTASPSKDQAFRLNARADGGAQLSYKSNRAGVTVSENGTVTIKKRFAGSAVITITAAETRCTLGAEKKVTVTVKKASNKIRVAKSFNRTANTLKDQTFRLNAAADGGAQLSYKSNRAGVTVSETGKVTIKKGFAGKAVITITAAETKCTLPAETKVTVKVNLTAPELSSVKWDSRKMTIEVAWNKNITAKGYVIQFSSQKSFATVEKKIKIDSGNTVRISVPGPKRGTYYVRIRTINRELHSRWSRIKTVNVKYRTLKRAN